VKETVKGTLIVLAKEPVAGRVKTRLQSEFTAQEAAALARASLVDTLGAVLAARASRRVLALEGDPGPWLPAGFTVAGQRGDGLVAVKTALAIGAEVGGRPLAEDGQGGIAALERPGGQREREVRHRVGAQVDER